MSARATALALLALLAVAACGAPPAPVPAPVVPTMAAPAVSAAVTAAPPAPTAIASAAPVASATPAAPASPCPEGMAYLPAGEYVFGQTAKQTVKVAAFCLDLNEVSTDAYTACVKGGKCDGGYTTVCDPSTAGKDGRGKMPMVCVDFPQAEKYCTAQGKRLPSTEEWEWAARGASASAPHPWGDADLGDQICWSGKAKRELPCEIGSFPGGDSPQGVHDLLGGVFEWTTSSADATSVNRIVRGGSWKDGDKPLFAVARQGVFKTTYRCGFVGIRCAQAAPGPAR